MKELFDKNRWVIELVGIASIVASLIFVAFELQQTNRLAKAQMRNEVAQSAIENMGMFQTSEAISIINTFTGGEALDRGEQLWLETQFRREFRAWENVHYQYRAGLYDENEMDSYRYYWGIRVAECPTNFSNFYFDNRLQFEPNFRSEFDNIFLGAGCSQENL